MPSMEITFSSEAWQDYLWWVRQDIKTFNKINDLINDIERNGNIGIGHPEPLKNANGYWSRHINKKDRLIYKIVDKNIRIAYCRNHYDDH